MLDLLLKVTLGELEATALQVWAAIVAVQYTRAKKGEGGKKDAEKEAAKRVAGSFSSSPPPAKLRVVGS